MVFVPQGVTCAWRICFTINIISQSTIDVVNRKVSRISSSQSDEAPKTRGNYIKITAKDRATVGEYAAKNGIAAAHNIWIHLN